MTMPDHIIKAGNTEAEAKALLPEYVNQDGSWDGNVLGPQQNFRGVVSRATYDAQGNQTAPEVILSGVYIGIATTDEVESLRLRALPNDACRLVLNRDASGMGPQNWAIIYVAPVVDQAQFASVIFDPVFAGSKYY